MNMYAPLVSLVLLVSAAEAAKILGIFMVPSYSHQRVYQPIWKELSLKGHNVTIYTPNPLRDPTLTNLTEIDLGFSYEVWRNYSNNNFQKHSKIEETKNLFKAFSAIYNAQMSSPQMQQLLAKKDKENYDLLLVEYLYPPMYPFKDVFNCPMVGITSLPLTTVASENLGMFKNPAVDPDFLLPFSTDLSFKQRVISALLYVATKINVALTLGPSLNEEARKYFGKDTRDVIEISKEVSLVLGNYNPVSHNVRPIAHSFVEISGIHLEPPKPLPKDLKEFLDEATEGVVYFSLGSNVKSALLPEEKLNAILAAFSELTYKVLFKFESDSLQNVSSLPTNVEVRKWIPQQDVLSHPNIKLFVTQGGLQSIDEALNSKVPMLIIPVFGDQNFNAHKMVNSGAGLSIDFNEFTKESLVETINKIIQNPEYKKTIEKLGARAFDQQVPPLEKAVWWIEYVLRHNGADHLRYKGTRIPFYQLYLLDVLFFLGTVTFLTIYIISKICKKLISGFNIANRKKFNSNSKKSQ